MAARAWRRSMRVCAGWRGASSRVGMLSVGAHLVRDRGAVSIPFREAVAHREGFSGWAAPLHTRPKHTDQRQRQQYLQPRQPAFARRTPRLAHAVAEVE